MKKLNEVKLFVYVFHGEGARYAAAIYDSLEDAKASIYLHRLTGLLTQYPVGCTVYEYAIEKGYFSPHKKGESKFIQSFTTASLEHYHFENGELELQ